MNAQLPAKLQARINELELAIIAANTWVEAGEGVALGYYCEPSFQEDHLLAVIQEVLARHCFSETSMLIQANLINQQDDQAKAVVKI